SRPGATLHHRGVPTPRPEAGLLRALRCLVACRRAGADGRLDAGSRPRDRPRGLDRPATAGAGRPPGTRVVNRTRRGVLAAGSAAAAATAVAALALTAWGAFLLQPRADEPVRADAVVML